MKNAMTRNRVPTVAALVCLAAVSAAALWDAGTTLGGESAGAPLPQPQKQKLFTGCRIPALAITLKGTILAFCEHRITCSDHGNVDLIVRRSTDGGKTWGKRILVHDARGRASGNPCPVVDRTTGIVWLAFASQNNKTAMITHSKDEGKTWAKPIDITKQVKRKTWSWFAFGPCHGIQLKSGRILFPANHHQVKIKRNAPKDDPYGVHGHVVYSDDHGKTWKLGGTTPGYKMNENSVTETVDGTLYMNGRCYGGRRRCSWSRDGGLTWSPVMRNKTVPGITDPSQFGTGCQANAIRFTNEGFHDRNRVLFSNPAGKKRANLTVRISYDECKSWTKGKLLQKGQSGYSDLVVLPDMSIGCLYEGPGGIWFARFTLDWLTDGKDRLDRGKFTLANNK